MKIRKSSLIIIGVLVLLLVINTPYLVNRATSELINKRVDDTPGIAPENTYPLILLHGFNPTYSKRLSEFSMNFLQDAIVKDLDYVNKGLLISTTTCAELRYSTNPIVVRTSYFEAGDLVGVEEYSDNLKLIIDKVLYCTGAQRVDVIAHSMGGIVTRNYLIEHENVRKLIMLGTPNNGELYNIGELATLIPSQQLDVFQLTAESPVLRYLNNQKPRNGVDYTTIAGKIDDIGDGIIPVTSVALPYANNTIVECQHMTLKNPHLCRAAYEHILTLLG